MSKIYFRLVIILVLVGAVFYVANYKYKNVPRSFFIEGSNLINESFYVIMNENGDTLFTETLAIYKGTYQYYFENKKFPYKSKQLCEAFRLVTDSIEEPLWGSYEKFAKVNEDSITRTYALYSTFQPELMMTMPVIDYLSKPKQSIDLEHDYLIFNGLYGVMNAQGWKSNTINKDYEFVTLDTTTREYKTSSISTYYTAPDSTKKYSWALVRNSTDTLFTIKGSPNVNTVNSIKDHQNKLIIKRVYGRDYQYKSISPEELKKQLKAKT